MIRVIIADDHSIVRQGIARLLDDHADVTVVAEIDAADDVVPTVLRLGCDVLLLDLSFPNRSGISILAELRQAACPARVIILSMHPEDQLALHLMKEGAAAYLNKQRTPAEVLSAVRQVAAGGRYITETLSTLAFTADSEQPPHGRLTAREYQVFVLLIEGLSVSRVAGELSLTGSTVSNHVAAIKRKLNAGSIAEIVRYAARLGLL